MNSFTEFRPLSFDGNDYVTTKIVNKKEFDGSLKEVLEYYNEDFKVSKEGTISIKNKLQSDKELINNYTKKALDKNWKNNQ
ncbi:hypothetical protein ABXT08_20865 [Chryseobacterium sp. NRRL B-14859]|uniref:hypothetical protein n=1 Tax=Chryseobacterium sp. NRRL B-14859 TaxID=1562763 RepID=UPI00339666B7